MPITPTVLGTVTKAGESYLVVIAGEDAENLDVVHAPLVGSGEGLVAAFVAACKRLGYGGDKGEEASSPVSAVGTDETPQTMEEVIPVEGETHPGYASHVDGNEPSEE